MGSAVDVTQGTEPTSDADTARCTYNVGGPDEDSRSCDRPAVARWRLGSLTVTVSCKRHDSLVAFAVTSMKARYQREAL